MPKILEAIFNAFDERFVLLYEDMEIRNANSASNRIMQNMCIILKSSVSGKDYITGQPTVQKLNKQVNTIKHIYNQFCDLPALQNLNIMKTVDTYIPLMEYTLQYVKYAVNFISMC